MRLGFCTACRHIPILKALIGEPRAGGPLIGSRGFLAARYSAKECLTALDSATQFTVMPPPNPKLCSHPVQRYAATEVLAG